MARGLVDATVVIAFVDTEDEDHEQGEEIVRAIDHGELVTGVVTHEALVETLNFVNERKGPTKANALLDSLEEGAHFRLPYGPKSNVGQGRGLLRQHSGLSYGDAMQVAYMLEEDIEYIYSFDDDFDSINGITRINRAENPFS
jgi:predicted nucleic acid-binding protein